MIMMMLTVVCVRHHRDTTLGEHLHNVFGMSPSQAGQWAVSA
jgi:hypothetical protein